ncbi:MAG TPA: helix-turn-helix transcriptional regulator [Candidatus Binatia bacterium]|nr:helix-turn-helix transcriptional regulator [Candidatus Binatia bacterium]
MEILDWTRDAALDGLSPREREVVRQVVRGLRNADVAATLRISKHTVRKHLQNVFTKLGVHRRAQLAAYAERGAPG